jgi:predicted AAA+ superfamily ATPase
MTIIPRYLSEQVQDDLREKMVFVGGARQVGKTTFALGYLEPSKPDNPAYLNWDNVQVRSSLMRGELPPNEKLIILDEVHKYARWRNLVKGFYDTYRGRTSFLITGSARLDLFRRGGDSLQGRYHYHRLHPFSPREINKSPTRSDVEQLLKFGGFPEPFIKAEERSWRRWQRERLTRVVYDDIRDLENVREISLIELLVEELPDRVGSPLSVRNLQNTLQVAHETAERWLAILERVYLCFRIPPFGAPRIRAVKKEQKLYLTDWSRVTGSGERFENFVACQLLKYCHFIEDSEGFPMELRFLRDTDKREIDFVVLKEKRPLFAVECKTGERGISPAVSYFRERTVIPSFYQVHLGTKDWGDAERNVRVLPYHVFCKELALP